MSVSEEALEIIREEEQILAQTLELLRSQQLRNAKLASRESTRARELTSEIVNAYRVEDKQLLASDEAVSHGMLGNYLSETKIIEKLIKKPYFARLILEEPQQDSAPKRIEYKIGYAANPDCRIIDWRKAPLSKLYYEYKESDYYSVTILDREREGQVLLRHTVDIEKGRLLRLTCRLGTFVFEGGEWKQLEGGARARTAGGLPEIAALITQEQFQTITEGATTAVLIQGIAGSGKTTVGLHRLAWLLHSENSDLTAEDAAIVLRTNTLRAYVSTTLPALDVSGVATLTFRELAERSVVVALPEYKDPGGRVRRPGSPTPRSIARMLSSMALLSTVEELAETERVKFQRKLRERVAFSELPSGLGKLLERESGSTFAWLDALQDGVKQALSFVSSTSPQYAKLPQAAGVVKELRGLAGDLVADIKTALADSKRIVERDETKLIDEQLVRETLRYVEATMAEGSIDPWLDPLIMRLYQIKSGATIRHNGEVARYRHLVVDEIQDWTGPELACVIGSVKELSGLTLVGDVGQRITEDAGFPGWDKLREHWRLGESLSKHVTLTVSHRSTLPVMQLADFVLGEQRTTTGRPGRAPIWFQCRKESTGIENAIGWMKKALERYPTSVSAVICRTPAEAKLVLSYLRPSFGPVARLGDDAEFSFEPGLVVTDVTQAKGLEFMNVLIWHPNRESYPQDDLHRRMLYVACTRAEENLCLVTWGARSALLPSPGSKLIRLVPEEPDERPSSEA